MILPCSRHRSSLSLLRPPLPLEAQDPRVSSSKAALAEGRTGGRQVLEENEDQRCGIRGPEVSRNRPDPLCSDRSVRPSLINIRLEDF